MKLVLTGLKLVFVAAVALVLADAIALRGAVASAQPSQGSGADSSVTVYKQPQALFERSAASMPDEIDQNRPISAGPVIGLICAIAASSVALGIAFGIRRRIDRIAGPDPDKADDD